MSEPIPDRPSLEWIRDLRNAHYEESKHTAVTDLDAGYFEDGGLAERLGLKIVPASRTERLRRL